MDDISIITDVINKEEKGGIFMRIKAELENLDPVGKIIQVTGKEVYMDNIVEERGGAEERGLEYLDIWQGLNKERSKRTYPDRILDIQKESRRRYVYFT